MTRKQIAERIFNIIKVHLCGLCNKSNNQCVQEKATCDKSFTKLTNKLIDQLINPILKTQE